MCNIIIKNTLVVDGTGSRPFEADLALKGQNISEVGRLDDTRAVTVIDAGGCAVAPGTPLENLLALTEVARIH